jgi:CDP-alcohol phosphatidyltransferase 2
VPILLGVGLFAGALLTETFATLAIVSLVYIAMLPPAWRSYQRLRRAGTVAPVQTEPLPSDSTRPAESSGSSAP